MLQEACDALKPGVLVMFSAYSSYLAWLQANHPAFATRINRTFPLAGLSDEEAGLVLAKKMLAKRIVEDLEPTFPFDAEAVKELNRSASGNPRRLLELADLALEYAVAHRAHRIDGDVVRLMLASRQTASAGAAGPEPVRSEAPPKRGVSPSTPSGTHRAASPAGDAAPWSETPQL